MSVEEYSVVAESENGELIGDPSEDALFMMMEDLDKVNNSCITIEPVGSNRGWYVAIALTEEEAYQVEFRDPKTRDHEVCIEVDRGRLARSITQWIAWRPGYQTHRSPED